MGVAVENYVDIFRGAIRRDVNETKSDSVSLQVDRERPIEIAVAISAHDGDRRPERLNCLQNAGRTNIAEMPDLVRIARQGFEIPRQFVMRVGEDENFHAPGGSAAPRAMPNICGFAA